MISALVELVQLIYGSESSVLLQRPVFSGTEREALAVCIDFNFNSSSARTSP